MNTKTQSLTSEQITEKILNSKGNFLRAAWKSNPKPAAKHKGVDLEKRTTAIVRSGISYENLSAVQKGIEEGTRGEVESLPWGEWKVDSQGESLFPYVIEHKGQDYYRLYPTDSKCETHYYVNGEEVEKEKFAEYLTPGKARELFEEKNPLCFTVKADNIISTPEEL